MSYHQQLRNQNPTFSKKLTVTDITRLQILIKHAERYFPRTNNEANRMPLMFVDREDGQCAWIFEYQYENKKGYFFKSGWNSFIKQKKLQAYDTINFYVSTRPWMIGVTHAPRGPQPVYNMEFNVNYRQFIKEEGEDLCLGGEVNSGRVKIEDGNLGYAGEVNHYGVREEKDYEEIKEHANARKEIKLFGQIISIDQ